MKTNRIVFPLFICFALAGSLARAETMDAKKAEMMKAFQQYATPGTPHEALKALAGNWTYTSKMWEPGSEKPMESTGTSTLKMVMGGRFLQHETHGKAMGMPFEGMGMTGYNNLTQKYETTWYDNMATGIMHGMGTYDAATKTFTDSGEFTCPLSKKADKQRGYRSEWKIVDKNHTVFTMYANDDDGKEVKSMEMSFQRKKN